MLPLLSTLQTQATTMVGKNWTRMVLQNASVDTTLLANLQRVPQALSPAIGFSMYDLRPFYPLTAIPATSIGLICNYCHSRTPRSRLKINRSHYIVVFFFFILPPDSFEISQA